MKVYYRKRINQDYPGKTFDPLMEKRPERIAGALPTFEVIAEHHVEVLSRIPEEVFEFLYAKRDPKLSRVIRLKFRIKEDGVLFGWDVQQRDRGWPSNTVGGLKYGMMGGDFLDDWGGRPFRPNDLIDMTDPGRAQRPPWADTPR